MLMTIACQFRAGKCAKKPSNLSHSAISAVKLAKHILNSDEACPSDRRYVLCFDEHGCSHDLGSDVSCSHRPVGKRSLNSAAPDHSLKKFQQLCASEKIQ